MSKGILFDMDGVLVDSEPVIEAAAIKGLSEYGVNAKPEDFIPFVGAGEDNYIGGVAKKYGVEYKLEMKDRVYEIYTEIVDDNLKLYEGVKDVLESLRDRGYKLALASSADHIKIESNLRVAGIPRTYFETILGGEDVVNKKPAPDIYLLAAKRLGIDNKDCIVVEDALNGIQAATAAGSKSIGISTSFTKAQLSEVGGADYVCENIGEIISILK